jgi:hypothetical protein
LINVLALNTNGFFPFDSEPIEILENLARVGALAAVEVNIFDPE